MREGLGAFAVVERHARAVAPDEHVAVDALEVIGVGGEQARALQIGDSSPAAAVALASSATRSVKAIRMGTGIR